MRTYIQINPADNVVVAVKNLQTGASLDINGRTIVVLQDIPAGHKVALQDFKEGDHIIKYGAPIGHAREVITTGSWVNEKNIKTNLEGLREYEFNPQPIPEQPSRKSLSFNGYRRKNGEVGIRNEIWVIPTVGCVNGITHRLADRLRQETQGTMRSSHSLIITAVPNWETTMRIPGRFYETWFCIRMPVQFSLSG